MAVVSCLFSFYSSDMYHKYQHNRISPFPCWATNMHVGSLVWSSLCLDVHSLVSRGIVDIHPSYTLVLASLCCLGVLLFFLPWSACCFVLSRNLLLLSGIHTSLVLSAMLACLVLFGLVYQISLCRISLD